MVKLEPDSMKIDLAPDIKIPRHLAIIPDGNRRWARQHHLPTFVGHQRGFKRLQDLIRAMREWGVHTITIWAFSTENWERGKKELDYLMKLYEKIIDDSLAEAQKEKAKIIHLGRKDRIPKNLLKKITGAEEATRDFNGRVLNIALDYGGRDEILRAIARMSNVKWQMSNLDEEKFENFLDTAGQLYPNPDLLIRTSGELRTSGFLPWQTAYTEFYFFKKHLPDFTVEDLKEAILDYSRRERRFGK